MSSELEAIEAWVEKVSEVATPDIPGTVNPLPVEDVTRPDTPGETLDREELLAAAPAAEEGKFLVPQILGGE